MLQRIAAPMECATALDFANAMQDSLLITAASVQLTIIPILLAHVRPIIYFCISNCFFAVCSSEKTCNGNGECNDSGSCECDKGFDGADCSSCSGAGFTYPECSCMNLFIVSLLNINLWKDCEDDGDCYGNGVCHNGKCNCDTGFSSSSNCHSCASDYYNYPHCNCMLILYLNARN